MHTYIHKYIRRYVRNRTLILVFSVYEKKRKRALVNSKRISNPTCFSFPRYFFVKKRSHGLMSILALIQIELLTGPSQSSLVIESAAPKRVYGDKEWSNFERVID